MNQKLALRPLQQMGYRADLASNGIELMEGLERQRYDLALMDAHCPRWMGGKRRDASRCAGLPMGVRGSSP